MRTICAIRACVLLLLLLAPTLFAQGGYAGSVLRMGIASRSEAMGRAYTAVPGSPESAFFNPAASTAMRTRMIDLSIRALPLDRNFAYVGFSTAIRPGAKADGRQPPGGGLALSWIHASVGDIEGRDFDGERFDTFSNNQNLFNFTFALQVHPRLGIGLTTRIFWNRFPKLGDDDATIGARAFGVDFGAMLTVKDGVWLGAVIKNLNAALSWNSDQLYDRGRTTRDVLPKEWRLGAAVELLQKRLLLALDLESSDVQDPRVYAGAAWSATERLDVRGGLRAGEPTMGAAYDLKVAGKPTTLHYAFVLQGSEITGEHVFSWSFGF